MVILYHSQPKKEKPMLFWLNKNDNTSGMAFTRCPAGYELLALNETGKQKLKFINKA